MIKEPLKQNLIDKILDIISRQLSIPVKKINTSSNLEKDLRADSLDLIELTMTLEEQFDVEISDDDVYKMKTVQDIIDYFVRLNNIAK